MSGGEFAGGSGSVVGGGAGSGSEVKVSSKSPSGTPTATTALKMITLPQRIRARGVSPAFFGSATRGVMFASPSFFVLDRINVPLHFVRIDWLVPGCKVGLLQSRVDLLGDELPNVRPRSLQSCELHRCELVSRFHEAFERCLCVLAEGAAECLVGDEPSDQDLDAALCHGNRLSAPDG